SSVESVVYQSPKITGIVWEPSYYSAKITWYTNVNTTNNYVVIDGKKVSGSGNGGKVHIAWVSNLKPSTTYTFTVHSYHGGDLSKSSSGTTRMVIYGLETYDISNNGKVYFRIKWATTETPIGNNKVRYEFADGTQGEKTAQQYSNRPNIWFVDLENVQREKVNIGISFTVYGEGRAGIESKWGSGTAYKDSDYISPDIQNKPFLCDGLFNCEETLTSPYRRDSDNDGLWDGWRDYNGNHRYDTGEIPGEIGNPGGSCYIIWENNQRYTIYSGSIFYHCVLCFGYIPGSLSHLPDPVSQDIYVEVDWMGASGWFDGSHWLSNEAKSKLTGAFASHGIRLHIDEGELGGGNEVPHKDIFSFPDDLDAYRNSYSITARWNTFHYCVMAHKAPDGVLGRGSVRGLRMVVYDGEIRVWWIFGARAENVFMHELGHNIGVIDYDANGEVYCGDPSCVMQKGGGGSTTYCAHHWSQVDPASSFKDIWRGL
ncbi:MAG: hypothetical protein ACPL1Y_06620, partial [Thermoplasmata archaeon]